MNVLVIGSAPDAVRAAKWEMSAFDQVIAINNAWRVTNHWNELIFPYDFSDEKKPSKLPGMITPHFTNEGIHF